MAVNWPREKDVPSKESLQRAGSELKHDPPRVLAKTRRKKGAKAAEKQRVAILLSKARASDRKGYRKRG